MENNTSQKKAQREADLLNGKVVDVLKLLNGLTLPHVKWVLDRAKLTATHHSILEFTPIPLQEAFDKGDMPFSVPHGAVQAPMGENKPLFSQKNAEGETWGDIINGIEKNNQIEKAYGENYETVKPFINENGWIKASDLDWRELYLDHDLSFSGTNVGEVISFSYWRPLTLMHLPDFPLVDKADANNPIIGKDNICKTTSESCDDECCHPGARCNLSGGDIHENDLDKLNGLAKKAGFLPLSYDKAPSKPE